MASLSSLGLVVEGTYDEAILSRLLPRIVNIGGADLQIRPCGGSRLWQRFPGFLEELGRFRGGQPLDKAMVVADSGLLPSEGIEEQLAATVAGRTFRFPNAVQFFAVRQEIEALLLADEDAITRVAQVRRTGRRAPPTQETLEDILDPKRKLRSVLSECRLPYDPAVCGEIASEVNLERLRARCPSFGRFETKLHDC